MQDLNDNQSFYIKPVPKEWSQEMQLLIGAKSKLIIHRLSCLTNVINKQINGTMITIMNQDI